MMTKEHFQELINMENFLLNMKIPQNLVDLIPGKDNLNFYDLCMKANITDSIVEELAAIGCK